MSAEEDSSSSRVEVYPPLGLSGVLASSARLLQATFTQTLPVFVLLSAALSLLPAIFLFDLGASLILPLYLVIQVVLPSFLASVAFGITAIVCDRATSDAAPAMMKPIAQASTQMRRNAKDVVTAALFAGMICLALATFLGPIGLLLLATFFGPPILMQVISLEEVSMQEGWARTRALLKGSTLRILGYLVTIALGIGVIGALVVSIVDSTVSASPARAIIFGLIQIVVLSVTLPFLGAAQYACYRDLTFRASVE